MNQTTTERRPSAFISGTMLDLQAHRRSVVDACLRVGVQPLAQEDFPATLDSFAQLRSLIEKADIYIGILGFRYGFVPPGQEKSLTEFEFELAQARGIPCLLFMMNEDHPVRASDVETGPGAEKLQRFRTLAKRQAMVSEFRSPDELKAAVVTALVGLLHEKPRSPKPATALLLLPFDAAHEYLRRFLSTELERLGVRVLRPNEMVASGAIWANAISEAIRSADFVLVDATSTNPNVLYELGYVHALQKPTIILADAGALQRIPSDLGGFHFLTYDREDLDRLRRPIERLVHEYTEEARR